MHAAFLLPPNGTAGTHYVRHLAEALRQLGHGATLLEGDAPGAVLDTLPPDAVPVADGLCLPGLAGHPGLPRCVGLIHHPGATRTDAERDALPLLSRVVASSPDAAARLCRDFGVDQGRVTVVTAGTEAVKRSVGSGGPGCAVLAVGALTPRKGHGALLRALARLPDLDWTLTVAGDAGRDPEHPDVLRGLADSLGIAARLHLVPNPDDAVLEELWRGADVFALATRWEGYPVAVAQALRRGLPVATNTSVGSLVPMEAGMLCAPGDVDQLSKGLRRVIFDTALRADMAQAAWQAGQELPSWADQAALFVRAVGET